jgi:nucleotide-binding universal stress UspA family protein
MTKHLRLVAAGGAETKRKGVADRSAPATAGLRAMVVPLDLTPSSDRVLGRLALLPVAEGARVTLLHVVPGGLTQREQRIAERDAQKALAVEIRHLREQLPRKLRIESLVQTGNVAAEIAACATRLEAEMIIMGRGGGRALRDVFLGSTAERVTRQARLPVLVVRLAPRAAYSRPALALDVDDSADEVLRLMLTVLPPPRPWVDVIHAFEAPYRGMVYPSLHAEEADERKSELRSTAARQLATLLATALTKAKVPPEDVPRWKTHIRHGAPRLVVEKAVKKAETDLLVLGTRGYSGMAYVLLGTVAGDILRAARCDVLIVPPAPARA